MPCYVIHTANDDRLIIHLCREKFRRIQRTASFFCVVPPRPKIPFFLTGFSGAASARTLPSASSANLHSSSSCATNCRPDASAFFATSSASSWRHMRHEESKQTSALPLTNPIRSHIEVWLVEAVNTMDYFS